MPNESLYEQALKNMDMSVHALGSRVPAPVLVSLESSLGYRHIQKTIHQAIVQKLARYVSTLRAANLLLRAGFFQEQAALQRILDEIQEDVTFLAFSVIFEEPTPLHSAYLESFFEEEFDAASAIDSTQLRPMIPRKKIRAYIARVGNKAASPNAGLEAARTVSKAYSGYVHAASPQIMDMYGGNPPQFHTSGMKGTPLEDAHRDDLWNYFYRGILAFGFAASAFGDEKMFTSIFAFAEEFSKTENSSY